MCMHIHVQEPWCTFGHMRLWMNTHTTKPAHTVHNHSSTCKFSTLGNLRSYKPSCPHASSDPQPDECSRASNTDVSSDTCTSTHSLAIGWVAITLLHVNLQRHWQILHTDMHWHTQVVTSAEIFSKPVQLPDGELLAAGWPTWPGTKCSRPWRDGKSMPEAGAGRAASAGGGDAEQCRESFELRGSGSPGTWPRPLGWVTESYPHLRHPPAGAGAESTGGRGRIRCWRVDRSMPSGGRWSAAIVPSLQAGQPRDSRLLTSALWIITWINMYWVLIVCQALCSVTYLLTVIPLPFIERLFCARLCQPSGVLLHFHDDRLSPSAKEEPGSGIFKNLLKTVQLVTVQLVVKGLEPW